MGRNGHARENIIFTIYVTVRYLSPIQITLLVQ